MNDDWLTFLEQLNAAFDSFVRGDGAPYKALWSHADDITIFGAFGGYERGWDAVASRIDWAASKYREGTYSDEVLSEQAGPTIAYRIHLERLTTQTDQGMTTRERRVTHVVRREDGDWRIIHQHSDPLVKKQPPS